MVEGIESKKDPGIIIYSNLLHGTYDKLDDNCRTNLEERQRPGAAFVPETEVGELPAGLHFPKHFAAGTTASQLFVNCKTNHQR
jgi:hypothetical protein